MGCLKHALIAYNGEHHTHINSFKLILRGELKVFLLYKAPNIGTKEKSTIKIGSVCYSYL